MKVHTQYFKDNICLFGRQLDSKITYTIDNQQTILTSEQLNSISPHYKADILKSVMKQLDIDSNVEIPIGTEINYQFGCAIGEDENGMVYEYIDYGNYIVYSIEKQEDTNSYKIICYDKMLYSMKDYETMNITYPITIRNYINTICTHLGLTFKNINDTFANYDKQIAGELYLDSNGNGIGYTFRDVLDELAEVTASTICINEVDDELEIRYITETNDTIDEEYLKDINVNFGEKYGKVNSIVLSRSGGSDNVYLQDTESIEQNGLCEMKISDNQIMNFNDRADYLPDILYKLDGLEYYLNDFSSTGICYYNVCDRYTIKIGENYYSCVMFNDEPVITQGLVENIYTEIPEQGETDYTKADKTDLKINQTYLIVDKQNQQISSVISNVLEQNEKISQITQTVDELNSKISDIADITITGETSYATFTLDDINQSEPIMIKVRPITDNISYLYPRSNLYPSNTTYMTNRKIRFENLTTNEVIDYEIPDDLLYYDSTHYDEFYLDYDSHTCQVTKRCKYNADGTVGLLDNETTTSYPYPTIELNDGDYRLTLLGYQYGYLFVRLMASNIYTSQFATKTEVSSAIDQKADEIDLSVDQKLTNYSTTTQMNSAITLKANEINSVVSTKVGNDEIISKINQSAEQVQINANKISLDGKTINLTSDDIIISSSNFNVDSSGNATMNNATITGGNITLSGDTTTPKFRINSNSDSTKYTIYFPNEIRMFNNGLATMRISNFMNAAGLSAWDVTDDNKQVQVNAWFIEIKDSTQRTTIQPSGISTPSVTQTSKEEHKKNFEKLDNALNIINNIDIYKYNMKTDKDTDKKHIGFVIGDKFNYSKEITSKDNDGVDLYSFVSVCCKAIQEQQKEIELLKERIDELCKK